MTSSRRDPKPLVSMHDVALRLWDGRTLERIHWEIWSDQQWTVIGPNGCGKSTLMKALCGQVPVSAGRIAYNFEQNGAWQDRREQGASPRDQIAYVAFDSQKMPLGHEGWFHQARWNSGVRQDTWSVQEFLSERHVNQINPYQVVEEHLDPSRYAAQRDRVVELLGIEALLGRDIQQISNGERRKVLLARALLKSPQLLVLDNPFTGLDAGFRDRLEQIISRLMDGDMRIILVTNGREELPPGVTHVLLMEHGGGVVQGPKEAILRSLSSRQEAILDQLETSEPPAVLEPKAAVTVAQSRVLVRMKNVSVSYDGVQILSEIDWTIRKGERWALLGHNGAGKTTLLSLILGDNPHAYANDITLFGKRRGSGESIWDIKRRIGWVAPELHLYYPKDTNCFDLVCSGFFDSIGRYYRCSAEQHKTAELWLQRLGMRQHAERSFGELSEGEQRMVLIVRALVKHPALLVLDEPCQGLDADNRDRVLQMVETIGNETDTTAIYVTHHGDALPSVITHVLRLDRGRIVSKVKMDGMEKRRVSHG